MNESDIISEGKTKMILRCPREYPSLRKLVKIRSKSILSKFDGKIKDGLEDKDIHATSTTCNVFRLLESKEISTHFVEQLDKRTFLAYLLSMFPIEVVARRRAEGSYLPRNPGVAKGFVFEDIVIELFFKDDENHDPIMKWKPEKGCFDLYKPKAPISPETYLGEYTLAYENLKLSIEEVIEVITEMQRQIFLILEEAFRKQNITLIDMKCEFGIDTNGNVRLGDVIDNDSWRIELDGELIDKQVYRDAKEMTEAIIGKLKENYAFVAQVTGNF